MPNDKSIDWNQVWKGILAISTSVSIIGAAASFALKPINAAADDRQAVKAAVKTAEEAKEAVQTVQASVNAVLSAQHRTEVEIAGVQAALAQLKESVARQERNAESDRKEIIGLLKRQNKEGDR